MAGRRREQARDWRPLVTWCAVVVVGAIAAVASYTHIYEQARASGQPPLDAHLEPLSVDGLIVAASLIALQEARREDPKLVLPRVMLVMGIVATLAANIASGASHGLSGEAYAAWPAIAFVGAAEMVIRHVRHGSHQLPAQPDQQVQQVAADNQDAARIALAASVAASNPLSQRQLETRFSLSRAEATRVRQQVLAGANGHGPDEQA